MTSKTELDLLTVPKPEQSGGKPANGLQTSMLGHESLDLGGVG
ncbi:hypothetical protein FHW67_000212 [Herbaspirillum sp. Sphag1AN]|nr:hypothetical protein [Herbaspirillum sp. Sphag1AN]MBB3244606.1 hypothetical protein [Herbaspirillum sp. Sphag64]